MGSTPVLGAFSVITNLRMELFEALLVSTVSVVMVMVGTLITCWLNINSD